MVSPPFGDVSQDVIHCATLDYLWLSADEAGTRISNRGASARRVYSTWPNGESRGKLNFFLAQEVLESLRQEKGEGWSIPSKNGLSPKAGRCARLEGM